METTNKIMHTTITTHAPKPTKELFIVEGKSAESTLQQAATSSKHHVLALQDKLINVETASVNKVMANEICQKLLNTLNCGIEDNCNSAQLAFTRIIILTDPDVDGTHTRLLLLKFFKKYLYKLLESERISLIIPPLYRIHLPAKSTTHYAWSDEEKQQLSTQKETAEITRLKGIAQFSQRACEQLFINPTSRTLLQVQKENV